MAGCTIMTVLISIIVVSRPGIMYNKQNIPFKQNILFNKPLYFHKVPHYMNLVPFQKELPHPCASDRLCADKEPQQ